MEGAPAKVTNLFLSVWALSSAWLFATLSMRFFQGRILEWVVISSSKGSSQPRDQARVSCVSCITGRFFHCWAIKEVPLPQSFRDCIWVRGKGQALESEIKPLAQPSSSLRNQIFQGSNSLTLPRINLSSTQWSSLTSPILPHTSHPLTQFWQWGKPSPSSFFLVPVCVCLEDDERGRRFLSYQSTI